MREIVHFAVGDCLPDISSIGLSSVSKIKGLERMEELFNDVLRIFRRCAEPKGVIADIGIEEFADVYQGEGKNAEKTPLAQIFPKACYLALFAITIGERVQGEISDLFTRRQFDRGFLLDAVASAAAEKTADRLEEHYCNLLLTTAATDPDIMVIRYSPGYCGWDLSGQRRLFQALRPEEIGITLRESFLMEPLKSVSGVFVAGRPEIHTFDNSYPFCAECKSPNCQKRIGKKREG